MSNTKKEQKEKKTQKQRFVETASNLEADESGESFEKAFGKLVPAKRLTKAD